MLVSNSANAHGANIFHKILLVHRGSVVPMSYVQIGQVAALLQDGHSTYLDCPLGSLSSCETSGVLSSLLAVSLLFVLDWLLLFPSSWETMLVISGSGVHVGGDTLVFQLL